METQTPGCHGSPSAGVLKAGAHGEGCTWNGETKRKRGAWEGGEGVDVGGGLVGLDFGAKHMAFCTVARV